MSPIPYSYIRLEGGEESITVFVEGKPIVVPNDHPNFENIRQALKEETITGAEIHELADISFAVSKRFDQLSERVAVKNGHVYFDGDIVDNSLTNQIVRFLNEDQEDWVPLVNFLEKVASNPNQDSRNMLYSWLDNRDFTITYDGDFIAYKGVQYNRDRDQYESIHRGFAVVDGEEVDGNVPNNIHSTVEFPRSKVAFDPKTPCSIGLHVGTYEYAKSYGNILLEVEVNPRDVVSVPVDSSSQKVRVCRYSILSLAGSEPYSEGLYDSYDSLETL